MSNTKWALWILLMTLSVSVSAQTFTLSPDGTSYIFKVVPTPSLWNTTNGNGVGQGDHAGDDYYADDWNMNSGGNTDCGASLVAGISGTVIYVKSNCTGTTSCGGGYGNVVVIQSDVNPSFVLKYSHLNAVNVSTGSYVSVGQTIGTCGATGGTSDYCHLHLILYKNIGSTQLTRLQNGNSPSGLSGGPSIHAAPFFCTATSFPSTLTVSPSSRSVTSGAGNTTFSVTSTTSWSAVDNVTWLSLSPSGLSGSGTLTASYSANTGAARTATITISGGGITRTVTVSQAAGSSTATLTVSPSSRSVGNTSGNTTFSLTANGSWTATDNATWLTLSPSSGSGNGTLTATYSANTGAARTATITIVRGTVTRTVTVSQAAGSSTATLTVSPSSRSVGNSSGNTTFTVTSTTSWSAVDNATWLSLSPTGLSGSGTLTASYSTNTGAARMATITISGGGITRTVTVSQAAGTGGITLANDNPCGAFNLPIVSSWSYTSGTNVGATTTTNPGPTTSCTFYGSDVWYSFVASSTTMTIQVGQTGTATDLMMALYSGNCNSLAGLTCDDDSGPGNMPKIVRSGLTVGARYYARVWGYSGQTGTFGIAVRTGSNLNDDTGTNSFTDNTGNTERSTDLKVYPNPARGMISISNLSENGQLTVTNLFGQVVKYIQVGTTDTTIDISDLPGGFYFVNYFDGTLSSVVKIELIK